MTRLSVCVALACTAMTLLVASMASADVRVQEKTRVWDFSVCEPQRLTLTAPALLGEASGKALQLRRERVNAMRWQGRWYYQYLGGGIYDFRARVWSPALGSFLQPDEFGYLTPTGTLWSWPGQNPYRWRDPSGRYAGPVPPGVGNPVGLA